jgi:parvulin-like peptidyl-prolyl isomerase
MFMERTGKSLLLSVVVGSLVVWTATAQPASSPNAAAAAPAKPDAKMTDLFPDTVVAKGKGVEIKRSQLDEEVIRVKAPYTMQQRQAPPQLDAQVLHQMIQLELLKAMATPEERAAGAKEAAKMMDEARKQFDSDEAFNLQLKAKDLTREVLLSKWTAGEVAKAVLVRQLKINVSDDEVKKFYDDNPAQFEEPEMVKVSHVLLSTKDLDTKVELSDEKKAAKKKLAEELVKRARGGEDFAKLAKQYSEDPGSKDKGGEYKFPRGQMVKEFEDASFSLQTNQVSEVVTTQFGYHIIKLYEKYAAKKHDLAESAPKIKDYLTQVAITKQAPEYLKKLRRDSDIEVLDEKLKLPEGADDVTASSSAPSQPPLKKP